MKSDDMYFKTKYIISLYPKAMFPLHACSIVPHCKFIPKGFSNWTFHRWMEWCLINVMAMRTIGLLLHFHLVQNFICIQDIETRIILPHLCHEKEVTIFTSLFFFSKESMDLIQITSVKKKLQKYYNMPQRF